MAMGMRLLCLFFVLYPSIAVNLRSKDGKTSQSTSISIPMVSPSLDTLEAGFSYSEPVGAGCKLRPQELDNFKSGPSFVAGVSMSATFSALPDKTPAKNYNIEGWSGFCEMGWSLCPDAKANKDYTFYAKGLGVDWVKLAGAVDKEYCGLNGWLKPEIATLVHNFTALQAKGEELCKTKYAKFSETATLLGIQDAMRAGLADNFNGDKSLPQVLLEARTDPARLIMDETASGMAAAWNCALGDLSCDIAYCNYAYCEKGDGSYGVMEECEGWDKVHGMPATRAS